MTLSVADHHRILRILEECGVASTGDAFDHDVLDGVALWPGFDVTTLALGSAPPALVPATMRSLTVRGLDESVCDSWWQHWRWRDVWTSTLGNHALGTRGVATLDDVIGSEAGASDREFVEDFLRSLGVGGQIVAWIDTGVPVHAYLTVLREGPSPFSDNDFEFLGILRRQLAGLFRLRMSQGFSRRGGLADDGSMLSVRERSVATLVAAGESNRTVARRLGIREDTVKKHLSQVFVKLGIRSRTELAARWG